MQENLDIYLADFGVDAVTSRGTIKVIFDEDYLPMSLGAEGRSLTACGITSSFVGLHHGDSISIGSKNYKIVGIQPISDGLLTDLILKEV